ncbi:MAG: alpha/beta hydrolase [Acidobacteria bacterium]|nr:alpha/beta hydrolase [Acidobacteriota bacterium]MCB9397551.1 alpha/beta hydrolase [Acidobacteriota bacterium]
MRHVFFFLIVLGMAGCHSDLAENLLDTQTVRDGDQKWYYHHTRHSGPTLVFDHGAGDTLFTWTHIWAEVGDLGDVYMWDRSGNGASDWDGSPRTALQVTDEWDRFLTRAGARPPYILVGHSLGGLNAMAYAKRFPAKVQAVLLLDPSHWNQNERCLSTFETDACLNDVKLMDLPQPMRDELSHFDSYRDLMEDGTPFPDLPVTIISADEFQAVRYHERVVATANEWGAYWLDLQEELVDYTNARHIQNSHSGHYIHRENEPLFFDELRRLVR